MFLDRIEGFGALAILINIYCFIKRGCRVILDVHRFGIAGSNDEFIVMKKILLAFVLLMFSMTTVMSYAKGPNKLTRKEKKAGWVLLFNGKDFSGWRQCNGKKMAENWEIEDDAMKVYRMEGQKSSGDILFGDKQFKDFELSIDWKVSEGANSGIFYYIREEPGKPIYYAAPEVQVLDNVKAGDNKIKSHLAGSLYDMLPADPATVKPTGEWNTIVIRVKDGKATHVQNGTKVCEYTLWTDEWDNLIQNSKFKNFKGFTDGISRQGYIGLQDHGCTVWYRNIKIREL